jgi:hypothetical protein
MAVVNLSGENLGVFGLSEYERVANAYKKKKGIKLQVTSSEYGVIKQAYFSYIAAGGKPVKAASETPKVAVALKKYISVLPWKVNMALEGMLLASVVFPKIADVVDPNRAKARVSTAKKITAASKGKEIVVSPQNAVVDTSRNLAITVAIVAGVVLLLKFKK